MATATVGHVGGERWLDLGARDDPSDWPHRLETLLWNLPSAILLIDSSGEILRINAAAHTMLGRADDEGLTVEDLEPAAHRGALRRCLERAVHGPTGCDPFMLNAHGGRILVDLGVSVARDDVGGVAGWVVSIHDVTPRLLAAAAAGALHSELEPQDATAAVACVLRETVDFDHLLLDVVEDDTVRRIGSVGEFESQLPTAARFGLTEEPFATILERPILVEDTARHEGAHSRRLAAAGVGSYVMLPLVEQGELIAALVLCQREPGLVPPGLVDRLRGAIGPLGTAVRNMLLFERENAAVARLEALDELRRDLLAMVSHDLQNPLTAIAGWAALVRDRFDELPEETRHDLIARTARRATELGQLVEQTLDLGRIESGKLTFARQVMDIREVVDRCIQETQLLHPASRFTVLAPEQPVLVLADPLRQAQVLTNLLSNAVKYSGEEAAINVRLQLHATDAGDAEARILVDDHGRGVAPEDLERMFGRFERIGDTTVLAPVRGTGLGLYLCRMLVEGQGGRIWAENRPGGGTTITYTAPLAPDS